MVHEAVVAVDVAVSVKRKMWQANSTCSAPRYSIFTTFDAGHPILDTPSQNSLGYVRERDVKVRRRRIKDDIK